MNIEILGTFCSTMSKLKSVKSRSNVNKALLSSYVRSFQNIFALNRNRALSSSSY